MTMMLSGDRNQLMAATHEFKIGDRVQFGQGSPRAEGYVTGIQHPDVRIAAPIRGEWVDAPWRPMHVTPITVDHGDPLYEIGDEVVVRDCPDDTGIVVARDSYRAFGAPVACRRVLIRLNRPRGGVRWVGEGLVRFIAHTKWRQEDYPRGTIVARWSDLQQHGVSVHRVVDSMLTLFGVSHVRFTDNTSLPAWDVMHTGLAAPQSGAGRLALAADWKPIAYPPSMDEETFVTQYGWLLACLPVDGTTMTLPSPKDHWCQVSFSRVIGGCVQFKRYGVEYGDPCLPHEAARKLFLFFLGEKIDESTST